MSQKDQVSEKAQARLVPNSAEWPHVKIEMLQEAVSVAKRER